MNSILSQIIRSGPIVSDGAWGTQLQERGLAIGEVPDQWNLTHPNEVQEVARSYVEAGSQVILTNTFGANRIRLNDCDPSLGEQVDEINRAGVRISQEAAGSEVRVFASIGPTGKLLLADDVTPDLLHDIFSEQASSLAAEGADGIVIETMSDPEEAVIAIRAAKGTGLPVVGCMVFDSGADLDRTMMGTTPEQASEIMANAGADVIGANCGQGIAGFIPICKRLKLSTGLPIWMKANAGMPVWVDGAAVYRMTPKEFASHAHGLLAAGADFIGGCCGTSPEFIRAVVEVSKIISS